MPSKSRSYKLHNDLVLIKSLTDEVARGGDIQTIIDLFARDIRESFNCIGASVYLLSDDTRYLEMRSQGILLAAVSKIGNLLGRKLPPVRIYLNKARSTGRP